MGFHKYPDFDELNEEQPVHEQKMWYKRVVNRNNVHGPWADIEHNSCLQMYAKQDTYNHCLSVGSALI